MPIDIKNLIIEKIKELNPSLDTRVGSVIRDVLINPLSSLLAEYQRDHDSVLTRHTLTDLTLLSEEELDAVAANFLVTRNTGAKSVGFVKFYFNAPRSFSLPAGTILETADGLEYETLATFSITSFQMQQNISEFPNYDTGDISVRSLKRGTVYNISKGTALVITDIAGTTPTKVVASNNFSGGTPTEDNTAFFNRLLEEVQNTSLASPRAIKSRITELVPDTVAVDVIGAGHPLMIRDFTSYITDVASYKTEDFRYVYSGIHSGAYDKGHIALVGNFVDTDETAVVSMPAITRWSQEFSNDMYQGIYDKDDAEYTEGGELYIAREFFDLIAEPNLEQSDLLLVLVSGGWSVNDGSNSNQQLFYIDEIGIDDGELRLGKTLDTKKEDVFVHIPYTWIKKIIEMTGSVTSVNGLLYEALSAERTIMRLHKNAEVRAGNYVIVSTEVMELISVTSNATYDEWIVVRGQMGTIPASHNANATVEKFEAKYTEEKMNATRTILSRMSSDDTFNNLSPIFHKQISQHLGVEITFTMRTTDSSEDGEMAYATVLRNNKVFVPHDGYGIAFRKQPGFLLRMQAGNHTQADLETFAEQYSMTVENAQTYVGNISNEENKQFWKYNIYLVDNDALQEEMWIGHDQLLDQTSGVNQFLQAGKIWMSPDKTYQFKVKIYENMGAEAWIFDVANPPENPYENAKRIINRGETYPPYVPQSGDKKTMDTGLGVLESYRNHFGLAVSQTRNSEWYFDTLIIRSFVQTFPMHLFKLKLDNKGFNVANPVRVNYHGVGYDPVKYLEDGNLGHSYVRTVAWNTASEVWTAVGTHEFTIDDVRANQLVTGTLPVLSNYLDSAGYVNIACTAINSGPDFSTDTLHNLRSYYIEVNNIDLDKVHRGNMMDIYVHDPQNVGESSATAVLSGTVLETKDMPGVDNYIQEIIEIREAISKAPFDTSNYNIVSEVSSLTYSKNANYKIIFEDTGLDGALIEVVYRHWTNGNLVDTLMAQEQYQYPLADQLIKIMPPTVVMVEKLEYSGGLGTSDMKGKIAEYFNGLTADTFDKSDLINVLYANGATYVDLDIDITIREYDTEGIRTTVILQDQSYNIRTDVASYFYTHVDELTGVAQI